MESMQIAPTNGMVARQEFGGMQVQHVPETAITASAAQAKAEVEAQYIVALQRPRDLEVVRDRFLRECSRPALARIARYRKPVGSSAVEGPSVRLAEVALRCMGNVRVSTPTIYDDEERRIVRVTVVDLESNSSASKDLTISKTVERKRLRDGQTPKGSRTNSYGERVYVVEASDDDLANKEAALVSKALRNQVFRIFPGWLLEEGMETVQSVLRGQIKKDPDAEKRQAVDAFAELGVRAEMLAEYLGHPMQDMTPDELLELRHVWSSLKERETTWSAVIEQRREERGQASSSGGEQPKGFKARTQAAAQRGRAVTEPGSKEPTPGERIAGNDDS